MSSPEALAVVVEMRKLWPHGWQRIDDEIAAAALDKFAAERIQDAADDAGDRIHAIAVKHGIVLREHVVREMVAFLREREG